MHGLDGGGLHRRDTPLAVGFDHLARGSVYFGSSRSVVLRCLARVFLRGIFGAFTTPENKGSLVSENPRLCETLIFKSLVSDPSE